MRSNTCQWKGQPPKNIISLTQQTLTNNTWWKDRLRIKNWRLRLRGLGLDLDLVGLGGQLTVTILLDGWWWCWLPLIDQIGGPPHKIFCSHSVHRIIGGKMGWTVVIQKRNDKKKEKCMCNVGWFLWHFCYPSQAFFFVFVLVLLGFLEFSSSDVWTVMLHLHISSPNGASSLSLMFLCILKQDISHTIIAICDLIITRGHANHVIFL